jgi:hypothetical protein
MRDLRINVQEPEDVAKSTLCPEIHLGSSAALSHNHGISKFLRDGRGAVGAAAIDNNQLGSRCPLPEMREE